MIKVDDLVQVMIGRCDDEDLCEWVEEHGYPVIRVTHVEDDSLWGEVFPSGESVEYHMEMKDVEFYGKYQDTAYYYIEQLKQYPPETIISVEDMDGNAIYPNCNFADHTDQDTPMAELLLPIYLRDIVIEPNCEGDVFVNQDVKVWE